MQLKNIFELLGKKWTIKIIRLLVVENLRYSELKNSLNNISHKMLSQRLAQLNEMGIILKIVLNAIPTITEYRITLLGEKIMEIVTYTEKKLTSDN